MRRRQSRPRRQQRKYIDIRDKIQRAAFAGKYGWDCPDDEDPEAMDLFIQACERDDERDRQAAQLRDRP